MVDEQGAEEEVENEDPELDAYRDFQEKVAYELSGVYDRAVMTLSGGALAISFAFLKEVVPEPSKCSVGILWWAWLSLGGSLACVILGMLFSQSAVRKVIKQVDAGTIRKGRPGGVFSVITTGLTWGSGSLFVAGVVLLAYFAKLNLSGG